MKKSRTRPSAKKVFVSWTISTSIFAAVVLFYVRYVGDPPPVFIFLLGIFCTLLWHFLLRHSLYREPDAKKPETKDEIDPVIGDQWRHPPRS